MYLFMNLLIDFINYMYQKTLKTGSINSTVKQTTVSNVF